MSYGRIKLGADNWIRTSDLLITNEVRYRLCHISVIGSDGEFRDPDLMRMKQLLCL
jgi:hypothetical protein